MIETYGFKEVLRSARPMLDEAMQNYAIKNKEFCLVSPDVSRAGMPEFIKKFPKQHFNVGIAEQCAVDFAAGMAMEGRLPFIYGMSVFMSMRSCENIRTNVCYQNANVKIIGNNTGLAGGGGSTHYAMEDLAILRSFPNLTLIVPGDPDQALKAFYAAIERQGPVYIRLSNGRNESAVYKSEYEFTIGKGIVIRKGDAATVVACGIMVSYALEAARILSEKENISISVVDMHTLKPLDTSLVCEMARSTGRMITLEDHTINGGLGGAVAETLAESGIPCKLKRLGIPDTFPGFGSFEALQDKLGYGIDAVIAQVKAML
jgi:transketolase